MKRLSLVLVLAASSAAVIAADPLPSGHPPVGAAKPAAGGPRAQLPQKGKVLSVIDVPPYTYLEVAQNRQTIWIAGPTVAAKKGDVIRFEDGTVMNNFHSKTLNRDFRNISFVSQVVVTKEKE